jgi:hypothetical protein
MMKKLLLTLVFGILGVGVYGQTIKSLGYNTTNGQVVYSGTNNLNFTNSITFGTDGTMKLTVTPTEITVYSAPAGENILTLPIDDTPIFSSGYYWNDPSIRAVFGFATNLNTLWTSDTISSFRTNLGLGATWLTNTNVTNFRTAIGLGETNNVKFNQISIDDVFTSGSFISVGNSVLLSRDINNDDGFTVYFTGSGKVYVGNDGVDIYSGSLRFSNNAVGASQTRTNLGLGNGITTNRTFVYYDGTNYTTNSVTISNGIITGWTQ